ncbi:uncharacterized protein IL334_000023 [Kwoniella shivajii]|uniref:DNA mismatch repair proteins mutS family domain-containing protein n=1 Tax=Kwoniella shivajii TaxID=564305 RepID=A0ABZ1CNC9_9TREE|nr:hypothetical protein IL334_000023 [Kwoniella shivajii]
MVLIPVRSQVTMLPPAKRPSSSLFRHPSSPSVNVAEESDTSRRVKCRVTQHEHESPFLIDQHQNEANTANTSTYHILSANRVLDRSTYSEHPQEQESYLPESLLPFPTPSPYHQYRHSAQIPQYDRYPTRDRQSPFLDYKPRSLLSSNSLPISSPIQGTTVFPISHVNEDELEKYLNQEGVLGNNTDRNIKQWTNDGSPVMGSDEINRYANPGEEEALDEEQTEKVVGKRILAIHGPYVGNIGAAWYDPEKRKIQVLEDTKDTLGWDLALLLMEQVQPELIVISSKTQDGLVDQARLWDEQNDRSGFELQSTRLLILANQYCSPGYAFSQLATLNLPDDALLPQADHAIETSSFSEEATTRCVGQPWLDSNAGMGKTRLSLVKLGCWVNVDAPLATAATGALIHQIKKELSEDLESGGDRSPLQLNSIESMELERHMRINKDALTSLGIFDVEAHGSMFRTDHKPAVSIHGLLDTCVTPLGKKLFHTWHLRPLADLKEITARHDAVSLLSAHENVSMVADISNHMKRIKNLPAVFGKLKSGAVKYREWINIKDTLSAVGIVQGKILDMAGHTEVPVINRLRTGISPEVDIMFNSIQAVIDWDVSKYQSHMGVRLGVNQELDEMKQTYAGLDGLLTEVSRPLRYKIPRGIATSFNVLYLPQIGFYSVIGVDESMSPPEISGWECKFSTPDKFYYKNQEMHELDMHFGDIYIRMTNAEIDQVQFLVGALLEREASLLSSIDVIAELDCLLALSQAVRAYDLHRPTMTNDNTLKVREGRHILYDRVCDRYISNDIVLESGPDGDHHNMVIVTGANGSGKSAYGKQVAVLVFMAQIGSFVPAKEAVVGICDKIFTRLQTKESSSKHASAFMIDLGQVSQALRGATERSLIILDEFGKGTITWDGAGLLAGVIHYLQKGLCPRTVVLTHFHELITQRFLDDVDGVMFAYMRTMMSENNELNFLYKLAPGSSHTSYAAQCASQHGIPQEIVERAKFVTACVSKFELSKIYNTAPTPQQERQIEANDELAKRFMAWRMDPEVDEIKLTLQKLLEDTDVNQVEESDKESDPSSRFKDLPENIEGSVALEDVDDGMSYGEIRHDEGGPNNRRIYDECDEVEVDQLDGSEDDNPQRDQYWYQGRDE